MKKIILICSILVSTLPLSLQAQFLEGVMSDGVLMAEGKLAVSASLDIDNEGLFLRGRYAIGFGELFGGLGLYDDNVGTHVYLGLERAHKSFQMGEGVNLNGFYQFGFAFRQTDIAGTDLSSTTLRSAYLLRYAINDRISTYSGLNAAFVIQTVDTQILGTSTSNSDNDIQFTLPVGARFKLDDAGKMNVFTELGLGFSSGAGYFHAGFRYNL